MPRLIIVNKILTISRAVEAKKSIRTNQCKCEQDACAASILFQLSYKELAYPSHAINFNFPALVLQAVVIELLLLPTMFTKCATPA